ncbi:MAG TPA: AAA family ATPase [Polyangiaceae bacterium]|nr:AAA family ATPase [Polyangiaceae bacterium]
MEAPREPLAARLRRVAALLDAQYLGKSEVIRLLLIAIVAREHVVVIGPPGTAKSALIKSLAELLDARYFEYLLTRFTEPNELFGPVDIQAFREGVYRRKTDGMLPEAELVFLDEIFKSNSAILNSLLTLLNERRLALGGQSIQSPILSVFGASNEVPADESLQALYDRFLLRIRSDNLEAYHFNELLLRGIQHEAERLTGHARASLVAGHELQSLAATLAPRLDFSEEFLGTYKGLIFQIRAEGVSVSDRRVVKLLKLFAASALLDGREAADFGDLFVLKHIWNSEDQAPIVAGLVEPVVEAFYREHPERQRVGALGVGLTALSSEIDRIRQVLIGETAPSDLQLFSQLGALGEIRARLSQVRGDEARTLERRVAELLDAAFQSGRFAQL